LLAIFLVGVRTSNPRHSPIDLKAKAWNHVGMTYSSANIENPLASAAQTLGAICEDRQLTTSTMDAGSMARILVHIKNINSSVLASTDDHANAAKRLNDFATALARIARNTEAPNEQLVTRMSSVASDLRSASEKLAAADAIPNWQSSAVNS
jgi:hypothetical protein